MTEQLEEAQNKTDVMESERQTMVAEHHAATSQLHTLQLAHAALCAKYAELQIKHAHQKEHVETQSVELLSFQRDATKQLLADSAVEARKEARMAEITTLRRSLSEANRRLETAEACTAAVVRAGFDPAVFAASNSEITQATIDILRDQLQNVVVDGGAGAAAQGGQGGTQAAPAILGMLLGNLDGGAAIVQQHPELVGLVQNWMGGGGLSPAQIHQASLKAGLDPALADNLRIAATMLPTASGSANGLDPRALSAILTMLASVAPGQLEQLVSRIPVCCRLIHPTLRVGHCRIGDVRVYLERKCMGKRGRDRARSTHSRIIAGVRSVLLCATANVCGWGGRGSRRRRSDLCTRPSSGR